MWRASSQRRTAFDFGSLIAMTLVALLVLSQPGGTDGRGGVVMIGLFAGFYFAQALSA